MANTVTVTNLIQGVGSLYTGDFGATEPDDDAVNTTPATGDWTYTGGTLGGVKLAVNQTYTALAVDQTVDTPGRRLTAREATVQTQLAEVTLDNLIFALNGGTVTTGATFTAMEPEDPDIGAEPNYKAILFDGHAPGGKRRRFISRRTLSTDNVEFAYAKEDQTVYTVTLSSHYVSSSIKPFRITDEKEA